MEQVFINDLDHEITSKNDNGDRVISCQWYRTWKRYCFYIPPSVIDELDDSFKTFSKFNAMLEPWVDEGAPPRIMNISHLFNTRDYSLDKCVLGEPALTYRLRVRVEGVLNRPFVRPGKKKGTFRAFSLSEGGKLKTFTCPVEAQIEGINNLIHIWKGHAVHERTINLLDELHQHILNEIETKGVYIPLPSPSKLLL